MQKGSSLFLSFLVLTLKPKNSLRDSKRAQRGVKGQEKYLSCHLAFADHLFSTYLGRVNLLQNIGVRLEIFL